MGTFCISTGFGAIVLMGSKDRVFMQTKFSVIVGVCLCTFVHVCVCVCLLARGIVMRAKADTLCYSSLCSILFTRGQNVLHHF